MLLLLLKHHANRKAALPAIRVLFLSDAWTAQVDIRPPCCTTHFVVAVAAAVPITPAAVVAVAVQQNLKWQYNNQVV